MMEGRKLTNGWKDFAISHDFRIGDVIIFRHDGDLVFHVTGFGPSCCEIDYVQYCNNEDDQDRPGYAQDDDDVQDNMAPPLRKKHVKKSILEAEKESFSSDKSCFVATVTYTNLREDKQYLPHNFFRPDGLEIGSNKIVLMNEELKAWTLNLSFRKSTETFFMSFGWRSFCHENELKPGDFVKFKLERSNTGTPLLRFSTAESKSKIPTKHSSKRQRKETGESSQRVSSSEKRFVTVTITPASLKRNSRLFLRKKFITDNGLENLGGKKIILVDMHGVEWPVNLAMDKHYVRMSFGSGFKEFLHATGVKAYESLVLELVWEDITSPPMLKVLLQDEDLTQV